MSSRISRPIALISIVAVCGLACPAFAQEAASSAPARATTGNPSRDTLVRLTRPISVDFQDKRLEDVIAFIQASSNAELEPLWLDDKNSDGLDKEKLVSVKVDNKSFLSLIEKVMELGNTRETSTGKVKTLPSALMNAGQWTNENPSMIVEPIFASALWLWS